MNNSDILKIERIQKDLFTIRWGMTSLCNYNCRYCIQGNKKLKSSLAKGESKTNRDIICDKIIDFLENKIDKRYKKVKIYLIGGEVTILPDFLKILKRIITCNYKYKITIHIKTNLSFDYKYMKKLKHIVYSRTKYERKLIISGSYYKEYVSHDEFISKLLFFKKKNLIQKCMNKEIIMTNATYPILDDEDYHFYENVKSKYSTSLHSINALLIRDYPTNISNTIYKKIKDNLSNNTPTFKVYTKENKCFNISALRDLNLYLNNKKYFSPKNYYCDAGISSIEINNLGNVYRCINMNKNTFICNLIEEDLVLPKKCFKCKFEECVCSYLINIISNTKNN